MVLRIGMCSRLTSNICLWVDMILQLRVGYWTSSKVVEEIVESEVSEVQYVLIRIAKEYNQLCRIIQWDVFFTNYSIIQNNKYAYYVESLDSLHYQVDSKPNVSCSLLLLSNVTIWCESGDGDYGHGGGINTLWKLSPSIITLMIGPKQSRFTPLPHGSLSPQPSPAGSASLFSWL